MKTAFFRFVIISMVWIALPTFSQLIQPSDFQYLGAFRLPEGSGGSDWNYSGTGSAYNPNGDPAGPNDGFPGSIFAVGHDQQQFISEISIPIPAISKTQNAAELPAAATLQAFHDIKGNLFGELEIPRADLEVLPIQGSQTSPKLYFCWGQHFQFDRVPSHGWCELNLSNPQTAGLWFIGHYTNYITNDYLFEIPEAWAMAHAPGQRLATGRFRDGGWGGQGPALLAVGPWKDGNPPAWNATLSSVTLLLLYGIQVPGTPEIQNEETMKMKFYKETDEWSGGAWLTAGANSSVIFVGTKAMGKIWYGFGNGVVWPEEGPWPPVPAPPFDQRGWWADSIHAQVLFYNPNDLADVAHGRKKSWEPQPYAVMDLNPFLFDPGYDYSGYKTASLGDCCFDRARSILYLFERRADGDKSLVHAFRIRDSGTGIRGSDWKVRDSGKTGNFRLEQNRPNPISSGGNSSTSIRFDLSKQGFVVIRIFDIRGRLVKVLDRGTRTAGGHSIRWDGKNHAGIPVVQGVYICRMEVLSMDNEKFVQNMKMGVVR